MSCLRRSTCSIDGLLVPGWLERDTRGLAVDSSTSETLHVRRLAATLEGEKTQATLAGRDVGLAGAGFQACTGRRSVTIVAPAEMPPLSRSYATVHVLRSRVAPDRYRGVLRIFLEEAPDDPVIVPFTVDVRDGPLLAAIVLLAGICIGRTVQAHATPAAQLRDSLVRSLSPGACAGAVAGGAR